MRKSKYVRIDLSIMTFLEHEADSIPDGYEAIVDSMLRALARSKKVFDFQIDTAQITLAFPKKPPVPLTDTLTLRGRRSKIAVRTKVR